MICPLNLLTKAPANLGEFEGFPPRIGGAGGLFKHFLRDAFKTIIKHSPFFLFMCQKLEF